MKLIISEKPIAGKRIAEILSHGSISVSAQEKAQLFEFRKEGKEFGVIPLKGHIVEVDFPEKYSKWLGTDVRELIFAPIEYKGAEKAIITLLKKKAKDAEEVIIATDADREGESIGVEAVNYLKEKNPKIKISRAHFSAITPKDIDAAFQKLRKVDFALADSADARREIDLIWGAVLTRFLSLVSGRMGKEFLSVGRVQSPVLALIVKREKEIQAFKPEEYFLLKAIFEKDGKKFEAYHKKGQFKDRKEAEKILEKKKDKGIVVKVDKKIRTITKPLPFNTTSFLRSATALGFSAGEAMSIAEDLYMNGFISYPRTDNEVYPQNLDLMEVLNELGKVNEFNALVKKIHLQKEIVPSKGKKSEDHPPIYPVSSAQKNKLNERQWRIYELVARRFLATLAEDALTENISVEIDLNGEPFIATGQRILKLGWKEFYPYSTLSETLLPELNKGDIVKLIKLDLLEKWTQPPPRYSQGALIKLMEDLGLGTKCLTGDTKIKVLNSKKLNELPISLVFDSSKKREKIGGLEVASNNVFYCISLNKENKILTQKPIFLTKRPLKKGEKIFKVEFEDGSFIRATSEHPFYIFNGNYSFVPLSSLRLGVKVVSVLGEFNDECAECEEINFKDFLKMCNKSSCLFALKNDNELKKIRKKVNMSQREFSRFLGCSQGNYAAYEANKRPIPFWILKKLNIIPKKITTLNRKVVIQNPFPLKKNKAFSRVLANLIGDGSIDSEKLKRENCIDFRYHNTNPNLIQRFIGDIEEIFKIKLKKIKLAPEKGRKQRYFVRIPATIGRIFLILAPELTSKNVSLVLPKKFFSYFVGSLFDDEGHVHKNETKLFISNTNHKMLEEVGTMLASLGIKTRMDKKQHKLYITGKNNLSKFLEIIPIHSIEKKQRLIDLLSTKYKFGKENAPSLIMDKKIFSLIQHDSLSSIKLSRTLGVSKGCINSHIRELLKKKLVKKIVEGNNKDLPRKIYYKSLVDLSKSFYSLLGERVLTPQIITKTVKSVDEIPFKGEVFDISNGYGFPNFVLSNNVVVHNSTRHEIINKLYARRYISGIKAVQPNEVAFAVIDSLDKYSQKVIEPQMTAEIEKSMEEIAEEKKEKKQIVENSREILSAIVEELIKNKNEIGSEIRKALTKDSIVGKCPSCGGNLRILMSKNKKRFLGCSNYPKCTTTFPLPQKGRIIALNTACKECGMPMIKVSINRFNFNDCINPDCKSKDEWKKKMQEKKDSEKKN
ncbi:MAG: DNA topoisomerase [Candidatus Diapherotrites archaeon]